MKNDRNPLIESDVKTLSDQVRSLEQDLSEQGIKQLVHDAYRLHTQVQDRPGLSPFGQMILSLGKYLASKQSAAPPDTLPLMADLLNRLDTVSSDTTMDADTRKKQVNEAIARFKAFKKTWASSPLDPADLDELRAVVLGIDWEITDQTIAQFETADTRLRQKWKGRADCLTLLTIMKRMVTYIVRRKADAHSDAFDMLKAVMGTLEELIQTPHLTASEKKQLVETEVARFNRFKTNAAAKTPPAAPVPDTSSCGIDEEMPPALSHLKRESSPPSGPDTVDGDTDDMPPALSHLKRDRPAPAGADLTDGADDDLPPALSYLQKDGTGPPRGAPSLTRLTPDRSVVKPVPVQTNGPLKPALSGKQRSDPTSSGVMDDLLNPKESEADKMLDAIHLMEVSGTNPTHDPGAMMDQTQHLSTGMSEIARGKKDAPPIPEIGNKLDEFFNLDRGTAAGEQIEPGLPPTPDSGSETMADLQESSAPPDTDDDGIVPFAFEEDTPLPSPDEADLALLEKMISACAPTETPRTLDTADTGEMIRDAGILAQRWQEDPVKSALATLISHLLNRINQNASLPVLPDAPETTDIQNDREIQKDPNPEEEEEEEEMTGTAPEQPPSDTPTAANSPNGGIWSKFKKKMFRS